ncbi:MAG: PadR family transcriptional regulator [Candidatus Micrarchaeota archaeon]|nr:PadR family transcriptional regulator [Candidatus Micrarchaeota archaeon]
MQESKPVLRLRHALTHGNIWLAALAIIKSKKAYAYALPSQINKKFGFSPSKLMVYFVLYKLEGEGLIFSHFEGRRKYYSLSPKGRRALSEAKKILSQAARKL